MFAEAFMLKVAAIDPVPEWLKDKKPKPERKQRRDLGLEFLEEGYQFMHSPTVEGLSTGAKVGLPVAAISAIASPKGARLRNAAVLGTLAGALAGLPAAIQQAYANKLEDAHIKYHLDRMKYKRGDDAPGK